MFEYILAVAIISKGISQYFDSMLNNTLQITLNEIAPINLNNGFNSYFDFLAFGIPIIVAGKNLINLKQKIYYHFILNL